MKGEVIKTIVVLSCVMAIGFTLALVNVKSTKTTKEVLIDDVRLELETPVETPQVHAAPPDDGTPAADRLDGNWHVYDLPRVTQRGDGDLDDGFRNPGVSENGKFRHPFGQPNSHFPWLHPGGVQGDRQGELVVVRSIRWPRDIGPAIYQVKGSMPPNFFEQWNILWAWHFPVGTQFRVELFGGSGRFAVHEVSKVRPGPTVDTWEENHQSFGTSPVWYTPPDDCQKCHCDTMKHARILEPKSSDYYHWLRGSADGRFSWHPFDFDRSKGQQVARIRPHLRRFIVNPAQGK